MFYMTTLSEVTDATVQKLKAKIEASPQPVFEPVAQSFSEMVFREFKDSIALARVFMTVPFNDLPASNKSFVEKLAAAKSITSLLKPETLVLSLMGTHGSSSAWNHRKDSQGHVGIPLVSSSFIDSIPMMSRLLKELGLGIAWIDMPGKGVTTTAIGSIIGSFYVADAAVAVDEKNRKVIAAQDFVVAERIKTVFGIGGAYSQSRFMVAIIFTRESVPRRAVDLFTPLGGSLKKATADAVSKGKYFT
jgi:hypothetical protein